MTDSEINAMVRMNILLEYCKRSYGTSENPEMHFYVIPELRETDNEIIKDNAIHLIDENFVRGGVDDDGSQTFPWIRRITPTGTRLVEKIVDESESNIPELQAELKNKIDTQARIQEFIAYCVKSNHAQTTVLDIAKNILL